MRNRLLIPLALIGALGALAVAGCGGGDDTTSTAASGDVAAAALSEDEFLTQGNAICAAGNKEVDQAASQVFTQGQQPTEAQIAQFADILVPSVQGQIDAIRALPAPESIASEVGTFLDDAQTALDQVEADPQLLAAQGADDPFAPVAQEAKDIGLDECAA